MGLFTNLELSPRIDRLEDRLSTVERQQKADRLDWDELYEKMRRLYGRVQKRAERANGEGGGVEPPPPGDPAVARRLDPAQVFSRRYGGR